MSADNVEKFPDQPKHDTNPVSAFSAMRDQLASAATVIAAALGEIDPKKEPTTYQTYRWLGGAFVECQKKIDELAKTAGFTLLAVKPVDMILVQIPTLLADVEPRGFAAVTPFDLDQLPPGQAREPKFEEALKIKIKINRAWANLQQNLGALAAALASETYKLGITEEERAAAWRAERKRKLTETLLTTERQLADALGFVEKLRELRNDLLNKLEQNDQMVFEEIDPTKPVHLGDEE